MCWLPLMISLTYIRWLQTPCNAFFKMLLEAKTFLEVAHLTIQSVVVHTFHDVYLMMLLCGNARSYRQSLAANKSLFNYTFYMLLLCLLWSIKYPSTISNILPYKPNMPEKTYVSVYTKYILYHIIFKTLNKCKVIYL